LERKKLAPLKYPTDGTTNFPDTSSRVMRALGLDEDGLQSLISHMKGRTLTEAVEQLPEHELFKGTQIKCRRNYLKLVQDCHKKHNIEKISPPDDLCRFHLQCQSV